MNRLKVKLWGEEIGQLVWDNAARRAYFMSNPKSGIAHDFAPLSLPARNRNSFMPVYGDERPLYQGLPPFIADSLPDSWGNLLFDRWVKENRIPRNKVTPLYKLMFIGTRGMGALEYEPFAEDLAHTRAVDIGSLYGMARAILEERERAALGPDEELTLQALLAVGTSAGGRQMKAIVAINEATGEIRSGQTDAPEGFAYHILKFGDPAMPMAEIETAYYEMARAAGITMNRCRMFPVGGVNHFLTERFDRKDGKKIHVQTLAAMNPEARNYEDLVWTYRRLGLPESEVEELFRRLVFNVMTNNTDDHNKNFAFLLEENGQWRSAPAYDMTFIFNTGGTGPNEERRMSVGGKTREITKEDLMAFADRNEIRNAEATINRVAESIKDFRLHASKFGITQPWCGIIQKRLDDTLRAFGYLTKEEITPSAFNDRWGRHIENFAVSVNTKGYFEVSVFIDGKRHRRFVRPGAPLYSELMKHDLFALGIDEKNHLLETLFPLGKLEL